MRSTFNRHLNCNWAKFNRKVVVFVAHSRILNKVKSIVFPSTSITRDEIFRAAHLTPVWRAAPRLVPRETTVAGDENVAVVLSSLSFTSQLKCEASWSPAEIKIKNCEVHKSYFNQYGSNWCSERCLKWLWFCDPFFGRWIVRMISPGEAFTYQYFIRCGDVLHTCSAFLVACHL